MDAQSQSLLQPTEFPAEKPMYERVLQSPHIRSAYLGPAEERVGPSGAFSRVYRKGDKHVEVYIPTAGVFKAGLPALCAFTAFCLGLLALIVIKVVVAFMDSNSKVPVTFILLALVLSVVVSALVYRIITAACTQTVLIISPTEFRIKHTMEFRNCAPESLDPLEHAAVHGTPKDKSRWQVTGLSSDLTQAEVKQQLTFRSNPCWMLLLMEGTTKHLLRSDLSRTEGIWLAEEINNVIENQKVSEP